MNLSYYRSIRIIGISLIVLVIANCKKPESPNPLKEYNSASQYNGVAYTQPIVTFSTNIQGVVKTLEGDIISNAKVEAGDKFTYTDENGVFTIDKAAFTDDFCYIKVTKQGYFTGSTTLYGEKNKNYQTKVFMRSLGVPTVFTANQKKDIELVGGAKVEFSTGAFISNGNKKYNGQVYVYARHLNPDGALFPLTIPGRDLRAFDREGNDVLLYSYGMLDVEIYDEAGNKLQLAPNSETILTFPVSPKMKATAPQKIPLWYFDENFGVWIEEGEAKLVGADYIGTVKHFTPYNVDVRIPTTPRNRTRVPSSPPPSPPPPPAVGGFRGRIVNCLGQFVKFATIRIGQTTFGTDIFGNFSGVLPFGDYNIALYDDINNRFVELNKKINIVQGQTQVDLGAVALPCRASIFAEVNSCNNIAFTGYVVLKYQNKKQLILITDGVLQAEVPSNGQTATLTFYKNASGALRTKTIELPASNTVLDIGKISTCTDINWAKEAKFSFSYIEDNEEKEYEMKEFYYAETSFNDLDDITTIKFIDKNRTDSVRIVFLGNEASSYASPSGSGDYETPKVYMDINSLDLKRESINIILDIIEYQKGGWIFGMCEGVFAGASTGNPGGGSRVFPTGEVGGSSIKNVIFSVKVE